MNYKKKDKLKIPHDRSKTRRKEKLKEKECQFPNCKKSFISTGKAKFCLEHRESKYRKIIDKDKNELKRLENLKAQEINLTIKEDSNETRKIIALCRCCGEPYEIVILQGISVYSAYCPDHRNEYKRKRYLELFGNDNEKDS